MSLDVLDDLCANLHIILFLAFTFFKHIANMLGYDCSVTLEQFAHLFLSQPHSLILQPHIQSQCLVWLVNNYLIFSHSP